MIETEHLIIRNIKIEDKLLFIKMAEDGSLAECGLDPDCAKWMDMWILDACNFCLRNDPTRDWIAYSIVLKEENKVIGSVGCSYYEEFEKIGITYFIGAEYRGRGYASEAVRAYLQYFLQNYPVEEMIATIKEKNPASWKTVEKAGFYLEDIRLYQDYYDEKPEVYRFYSAKR